jgi:tRNA uridine 5-carboxymethylaminomethyl modification enzyme
VPHARRIGLCDDAAWAAFERRRGAVRAELERLARVVLAPSSSIDDALIAMGSTRLRGPLTLLELLRRPEIAHADLARFAEVSDDPAVAERVEVAVKYEGYLRRQEAEAERLARMEHVVLPDDLDYGVLAGLSNEAREKLGRARPRSLGQAARIPGITPAAVSVLATHVEARRRRRGEAR